MPVGIAHLQLSGFMPSVSIQVNQIESARITSPVWDYVSTERRFTFGLCTSTTIRDGFMFYHSFLVGLSCEILVKLMFYKFQATASTEAKFSPSLSTYYITRGFSTKVFH